MFYLLSFIVTNAAFNKVKNDSNKKLMILVFKYYSNFNTFKTNQDKSFILKMPLFKFNNLIQNCKAQTNWKLLQFKNSQKKWLLN